MDIGPDKAIRLLLKAARELAVYAGELDPEADQLVIDYYTCHAEMLIDLANEWSLGTPDVWEKEHGSNVVPFTGKKVNLP